jgi:hypothetical protein
VRWPCAAWPPQTRSRNRLNPARQHCCPVSIRSKPRRTGRHHHPGRRHGRIRGRRPVDKPATAVSAACCTRDGGLVPGVCCTQERRLGRRCHQHLQCTWCVARRALRCGRDHVSLGGEGRRRGPRTEERGGGGGICAQHAAGGEGPELGSALRLRRQLRHTQRESE